MGATGLYAEEVVQIHEQCWEEGEDTHVQVE